MAELKNESIKSYWKYNLFRWEKSRYHRWAVLNPLAWAIKIRLKRASDIVIKNSLNSEIWIDLGCGSGTLWSILRKHHIQYIGYDVSELGIKAAKKMYLKDQRAKFECIDVTEIDRLHADGFIMLGLVDWLRRDELINLLKILNGKHLIISFTEKGSKRFYLLYKYYHRIVRKSSVTNKYPKGYKMSQFIRMVESCGFSLEHMTTHGIGPGRIAHFTKRTIA